MYLKSASCLRQWHFRGVLIFLSQSTASNHLGHWLRKNAQRNGVTVEKLADDKPVACSKSKANVADLVQNN
jgi:hypothetical protein